MGTVACPQAWPALSAFQFCALFGVLCVIAFPFAMRAVRALQVIRMVGESQEPVGSTVGGGSTGSNKMPTLEEYGTNLTTLAEEVRLRGALAAIDGLSEN